MTDRKKPGVTFWATVIVVVVMVAIIGYAGAYWKFVEVAYSGGWPGSGTKVPIYPDFWPRGTTDQTWHSRAHRLFSAAHSIDRTIRPEFWK